MLTRPFMSALIAAMILTSGPVQALTCMRPDVGDSFNAAQQRAETFHVALGSLTRGAGNVPDGPETGDANNRVGYSFPAEFDGHFAGRDSFDSPQTVKVTVDVECVAAWCGGDSLSENALYFLRADGDGTYTLEASVCAMFYFENPIEHQLMAVIGLME